MSRFRSSSLSITILFVILTLKGISFLLVLLLTFFFFPFCLSLASDTRRKTYPVMTHIFCAIHGLVATLRVASGLKTLIDAAASNIINVDETLGDESCFGSETTVGRVDVREPEVEKVCLDH